jgi:flagellar hook protein FlgE
MASFYIPLTGLNADSTALNTIANNLANMNTTGYKSKSANFSDLFYQQVGEAGSGDPLQRGSGTQVCSIETDFSTGSPNTTNVDTNVALQGNGFFVVSNGGNTLLTRDGDFSLDQSGNLIASNGLSVMGFPAVNRQVDTNSPLSPVHIPVGEVEPPSATTTFGMSATLDSSANVGDSLSGKIPVYDSLGNEYQAAVTYTKTATNTWSYNITLPDTLTATNSAAGAVNTSLYNFGSSGGTVATVDPSTDLTITGPNAGGVSTTINAPTITAGESIGAYATDLQNALNAAGITATVRTSQRQAASFRIRFHPLHRPARSHSIPTATS